MKKKVEPAPQPVLPPEPAPNVDVLDNGTTARVSVVRTRNVRYGVGIQPAQIGKATSADPTLGILGPQFAAPQTRSLVADDAVPFIVPLQQDRPAGPVAVQKPTPSATGNSPVLREKHGQDARATRPPLPSPPVVEEPAGTTSLPSISKAIQGIALLPAADQKVASAQRTCPVTGDLLGADGKPMKVQLRGRTLFVCCEGCMDDLKANPQKYLANRPTLSAG